MGSATGPMILGIVIGAVLSGVAVGVVVAATMGDDDTLVASGGGVNLKSLPATDGGGTIPAMTEVFSFDRNHAFCRVDTNFAAFTMPTFALGDVEIGADQFFMAMDAATIDTYDIEELPDGTHQVTLSGRLDCRTQVGRGEGAMGSRTEGEFADYRIVAIDGGKGGGSAGDSFVFTVFFDAEEAPTNHAIFGPEFAFTGEMTSGEITIGAADSE